MVLILLNSFAAFFNRIISLIVAFRGFGVFVFSWDCFLSGVSGISVPESGSAVAWGSVSSVMGVLRG